MRSSFFIPLLLLAIAVAAEEPTRAYTTVGTIVDLHADGTWTRFTPAPSKLDGFRSVAWGSTKQVVKASQSAAPGHDAEAGLGYTDEVLGLPVDVLYRFAGDRLCAGEYRFTVKHMNSNDYVGDFRRVAKALAEKYGPPTEDQTLWKNDLFKNDPDSLGMAISSGHCLILQTWQADDQKLRLYLMGDNMKTNLGMEYTFQPLSEVEAQRKREQQKAKL